jgi:hypothetical protein
MEETGYNHDRPNARSWRGKHIHSFTTIHTSQNMKTGSISSKESDDDNVQDDGKLPALPLAMRCNDPILDTYDAWQREITPMPPLEFPGMKDPPPLTFLHCHTSFEDFNENGTTTPTNNNSPNNDTRNHRIPSPLKMPHDDILRTHDAEEACLDGERLPIMTSVFPRSVCLPYLDDQQHEHTAATFINANHTDHLFQQPNNNYATGGIAFDRNTIPPPTYNSNSITVATSISLSATTGRYHRNITSCEANANYNSPTRPILEDHPAIVTQSEITENPTHNSAVVEVNILPHGDQIQSEIKELSSEMYIAKTAGYGLVHYSPNSAFAVKAAPANHTKTPVASPVSSTIRPPTVAAVIGSEEGSDCQARIRKSDQHSIDPWVVKFNLLKKYKDEHNGSCDVPQKDPLGAWVNKVCQAESLSHSSSLAFS